MKEYREYIYDLANNGTDQVFFNSSAIHASLVMEAIFDKSTSINLFAGSLSGQVSDQENYREALCNFLERGGKLRIMLQKEKFESKTPRSGLFKFFHFFNVLKPGSVEVRKGSVRVTDGESDQEIHFVTGDSMRYRLENNVENFSATGNFKDETTAAKLNVVFDKIFSKGEVVTI